MLYGEDLNNAGDIFFHSLIAFSCKLSNRLCYHSHMLLITMKTHTEHAANSTAANSTVPYTGPDAYQVAAIFLVIYILTGIMLLAWWIATNEAAVSTNHYNYVNEEKHLTGLRKRQEETATPRR